MQIPFEFGQKNAYHLFVFPHLNLIPSSRKHNRGCPRIKQGQIFWPRAANPVFQVFSQRTETADLSKVKAKTRIITTFSVTKNWAKTRSLRGVQCFHPQSSCLRTIFIATNNWNDQPGSRFQVLQTVFPHTSSIKFSQRIGLFISLWKLISWLLPTFS